jgi:tRNA(fMet)-specific endonuclease VapC
MNESVLLDTSVVIAHFRKQAPLGNRFKESTLYIPLIVLGELLYGAYLVDFQAKMLRQIEEFLRICAVLIPNEETAHHYGRINAKLHKAGNPIPQNDVWIAAFALEHDLPVVTRDRHFESVEGLIVLSW